MKMTKLINPPAPFAYMMPYKNCLTKEKEIDEDDGVDGVDRKEDNMGGEKYFSDRN